MLHDEKTLAERRLANYKAEQELLALGWTCRMCDCVTKDIDLRPGSFPPPCGKCDYGTGFIWERPPTKAKA